MLGDEDGAEREQNHVGSAHVVPRASKPEPGYICQEGEFSAHHLTPPAFSFAYI